MKKKIAVLRIIGVLAFVVFVISLFNGSTLTGYLVFSELQKILITTSFACFGIIMLMQLYLFYFKSYYQDENGDDQE